MSRHVSNPEEEAKEYLPRYRLLYVVIALSALLIFGRLFYLQIFQGEKLRAYSDKNRVKETKIPAPRGLILDRQGEVLVENLPGFEAVIIPQYAKRLNETAIALAEILGIPEATIVDMVKQSRLRNGTFRPVKIKENLTLEEVARIKRIRVHHPGLNINATILRHYPIGEKAAQLLGYVGEISKKQINRLNKKFDGEFQLELGDIIGKSGIEEVWERKIRGKNGLSLLQVDARGRGKNVNPESLLGFQPKDAQPGNNLVLTIDKDIQVAAYEAMTMRQDKIGPRIGALVAVKPNGEVIAWVNSPSFDPNEFSTGISQDLWTQLINDPYKPLRNKVIQDHYSPGSTFKPFVALAALEEGHISPNTLIFSPGQFRYGNRVYHDHTRYGHGKINVVHAIERSSNVFFYKMGIALGIDKMAAYIHLLGIGEKTGINLNNEQSGSLPDRTWKLKRFGETWQPGENLSNAIGQGYVLTTPLQMALAYSAIGTGGKLYKPFLVKKIINYKNETIEEFQPHLVRDLTQTQEGDIKISPKTFEVVKEGLRNVANGEHGTARWWKIPGVEMAGKTGTVQIQSYSAEQIYENCEERAFDQRHHAWFVGYAPASHPLLSVAVFAAHSCHGSTGAAPVVRDVIWAYLKKYHPELLKPSKKSAPIHQTVATSGASGSSGNSNARVDESSETDREPEVGDLEE